MLNLKWKFACISSLLLCFSQGMAQPQQASADTRWLKDPEILKTLNITDEQVQCYEKVRLDYLEKAFNLFQDMSSESQKLQSVIRIIPWNDTKVRKQRKLLIQIRNDHLTLRSEKWLEIQKCFTEEQRPGIWDFYVKEFGRPYKSFETNPLQNAASKSGNVSEWWKNQDKVKQLGLREEQVECFDRTQADFKNVYSDLSGERAQEQARLASMNRAMPPDRKGIDAQKKLVAQIQEDIQKAMGENMRVRQKCFTEDQWQRIHEFLAKESGIQPKVEKYTLPNGEEVYRFEGDIPARNLKAAEVVKQKPVPYTIEARIARIEGSIDLEAVVGKDGKAFNIKVTRGLGYGLEKSAIETIEKKWKFKPATMDGEPINSYILIGISFEMR